MIYDDSSRDQRAEPRDESVGRRLFMAAGWRWQQKRS